MIRCHYCCLGFLKVAATSWWGGGDGFYSMKKLILFTRGPQKSSPVTNPIQSYPAFRVELEFGSVVYEEGGKPEKCEL